MIYDWSDSFLRFHESCLASKKGLLYFPTYLRLFQKNERERYYVLLLSLSLSWSFVFLFKNAFKHYYSRMNLLLDDRTAPRVQFHKKPYWKPVAVKPSGSALTLAFFIFQERGWNCGTGKYFPLRHPSQSIIIYLFYLLSAYHDLSTKEKLFQCASRGSFIHKTHQCNGIYECPDKSDENDCENGILL